MSDAQRKPASGVRTFQRGGAVGGSLDPTIDPYTEEGYLAAISQTRRDYLKEFGYPLVITEFMLQEMYRTNTAAKRMVKSIVNTTWEESPRLVDTSETDSEMVERKIASHFRRHRLWSKWAECDRRAQITGWSGMIFRIGDDEEADQPVGNLNSMGGIEAIQDIIPCWSSDLTPVFDEFEQVKAWTYTPRMTEYRFGLGRAQQLHPYKPISKDIHKDRVLVFSESGEPWGISPVHNAYYRLLDFQKILAAGAEGLRKNSRNAMIYEMDPKLTDAEVREFFGDEDGKLDNVGAEMQAVAEDFNEGRESALVLRGITAKTVTTTIPEMTSYVDATSRSIAMAGDMSMRQLSGNQDGQRSTTEDVDSWHETITSRRTREVTPLIQDMLYRFADWGILGPGDQDEWEPEWQPLSPRSSETRAKVAHYMHQINQGRMAANQTPLFPDDEIRAASGLEPMTEEQMEEAQESLDSSMPETIPMEPFPPAESSEQEGG